MRRKVYPITREGMEYSLLLGVWEPELRHGGTTPLPLLLISVTCGYEQGERGSCPPLVFFGGRSFNVSTPSKLSYSGHEKVSTAPHLPHHRLPVTVIDEAELRQRENWSYGGTVANTYCKVTSNATLAASEGDYVCSRRSPIHHPRIISWLCIVWNFAGHQTRSGLAVHRTAYHYHPLEQCKHRFNPFSSSKKALEIRESKQSLSILIKLTSH